MGEVSAYQERAAYHMRLSFCAKKEVKTGAIVFNTL